MGRINEVSMGSVGRKLKYGIVEEIKWVDN
jgi:hypothetical protein